MASAIPEDERAISEMIASGAQPHPLVAARVSEPTAPAAGVAGPAADTFDGLASRIDAAGFRIVGFTSALFGEGVSTIALGTAMSLASQRVDTVLLVDANWIEPSLTRDAHLESAAGLGDYLAKRADLASVVRRAAHGRIAFMPVGDRRVARPTLRSISSLLTDDLPNFQTVFIDLPPILPGEAFVLPWAASIDQLFVVVRAGATPLTVVRQALGKIGFGAPPLIVLNRAAVRSTFTAATRRSTRT